MPTSQEIQEYLLKENKMLRCEIATKDSQLEILNIRLTDQFSLNQKLADDNFNLQQQILMIKHLNG